METGLNFLRTAERRGLALIFAAALLWSSGGIGIKAIPDSPLKITFYRSIVAGVALLILLRPRLPRITPAFVVAVVSYAACLTSFVVATKWTTAANAIFLQYSGVIWVLLLSPLILREPLHLRDGIAIGVALCGMALFFVGKLSASASAGDAMAVLSSLFFAALVLSLRRERVDGAAAAVTYGNVLTAVALVPFVSSDLSLTPRSALVLALLGVFQIAVPYALFVIGIRYVRATQASLTGMIEPVANPLWVFLFLGERPAALSLVGGGIVLAAIAWRSLLTPPTLPTLPPPD